MKNTNEDFDPKTEPSVFRSKSLKTEKSEFADEIDLDAINIGDSKSFTLLFNQYYNQLINYAKSLIHDVYAAEDIVQDLFFNLLQSCKTIAIKGSLKSYLYGIVHNSCLNHIKHLSVMREYHDIVLAECIEASEINNPFTILVANETEQAIQRAINALHPPYKQIIALTMHEELSYAEVAQKLALPIGSIGPLRNRAIKTMKKLLKNEA